MKANGKRLYIPFTKVIVIPRGTVEEHIGFKAKSVDCLDEFEKLCPRPDPPEIEKPGGEKLPDFKNKEYKKLINEWATRQIDFICINSLVLPDDWEWETVDFVDPETFGNWRDELKEAKFTEAEVMILLNGVLVVNSMSDAAIKEAEKDFLAFQRQQEALRLKESTEQTST
jgi:hypothetical protein